MADATALACAAINDQNHAIRSLLEKDASINGAHHAQEYEVLALFAAIYTHLPLSLCFWTKELQYIP